MSASGIPDDAARMIRDNIDSVEQLEVLLLLQRTAPRTWNGSQVADELRIAAGSAQGRLQDLARRGFLAADDQSYSYRVGPQDGAVRALAQAYRERRVTVITMIFTRPDPARALADAFLIGGKGGG